MRLELSLIDRIKFVNAAECSCPAKTYFILAHNSDVEFIEELPLVKVLLEVKSITEIGKLVAFTQQGIN